jgi:excisionase family DNA binding protein
MRGSNSTRKQHVHQARTREEVRIMEPIARASESKTTDQPAESRWWSARRAAAYIGAGPKEIYKAVRSGKLRAVRLNGRGDIRTTREWVDEWMEQKQLEPRVM